MGADHGAPCHADAARHGRVLADAHVVADLNQVVELHAVLDDRVLQRTAVDASVGADLDVVADVHRPELLDLDPRAVVRCQTEAVGADHHAGMEQAALADMAILADGHTRLEHGVGTDAGARSITHSAPIDALGCTQASGSITALGCMRSAPDAHAPSSRAGSDARSRVRVGRDDEAHRVGSGSRMAGDTITQAAGRPPVPCGTWDGSGS
jgi:hypothetical protein